MCLSPLSSEPALHALPCKERQQQQPMLQGRALQVGLGWAGLDDEDDGPGLGVPARLPIITFTPQRCVRVYYRERGCSRDRFRDADERGMRDVLLLDLPLWATGRQAEPGPSSQSLLSTLLFHLPSLLPLRGPITLWGATAPGDELFARAAAAASAVAAGRTGSSISCEHQLPGAVWVHATLLFPSPSSQHVRSPAILCPGVWGRGMIRMPSLSFTVLHIHMYLTAWLVAGWQRSQRAVRLRASCQPTTCPASVCLPNKLPTTHKPLRGADQWPASIALAQTSPRALGRRPEAGRSSAEAGRWATHVDMTQPSTHTQRCAVTAVGEACESGAGHRLPQVPRQQQLRGGGGESEGAFPAG